MLKPLDYERKELQTSMNIHPWIDEPSNPIERRMWGVLFVLALSVASVLHLVPQRRFVFGHPVAVVAGASKLSACWIVIPLALACLIVLAAAFRRERRRADLILAIALAVSVCTSVLVFIFRASPTSLGG